MGKYVPLHCHSHYSLLDGLSKPEHIANRIEKLGIGACALTDHGNISGCIQFIKAMQKKKLKPILGCEMYLIGDSMTKEASNRKLWHQVMLASNLDGWKYLIQSTSDSNATERFYHKPRLDYKYYEDNPPKGIITFSGHLGSRLANVISGGNKIDPDWKKNGVREAEYLREVFGKDNFYIEIQLIDSLVNKFAGKVGEALREIAKITGIPCVATADSHYCEREDADDQRVSLCTNLKTTFERVHASFLNEEEFGLDSFFRSNNFHIPSYEEMAEIHTEEELRNTIEIAERCETYNVLSDPTPPPFKCPNGMGADEYLRALCRIGWKNKIENHISSSEIPTYTDRIKKELAVLQGAKLSSYFLVVQDIAKFVRDSGWMLGVARGSAAGSLTSYLLGITGIDPIKHGLIFERFYNEGRNTETRVSMPDIDMDVPVHKRAQVIQHVKDTYGEDNVAQMVTYQTMKGRGVVSNVLRAHGGMSFEDIKLITKHIPDEAKIADELQEMKDEFGESSIVMWALENKAAELKEWCYIAKDGTLQGPLSKRFEQAIRLEGTKTAQGKHAAGIVISPVPLSQVCPMIQDTKNKNLIAGLDMYDVESIGLIKIDILGIALLSKIMGVQQILSHGDINEDGYN